MSAQILGMLTYSLDDPAPHLLPFSASTKKVSKERKGVLNTSSVLLQQRAAPWGPRPRADG